MNINIKLETREIKAKKKRKLNQEYDFQLILKKK